MENISIFEHIYGFFWILGVILCIFIRPMYLAVSMDLLDIERVSKAKFILYIACSICFITVGVCTILTQRPLWKAILFIVGAIYYAYSSYLQWKILNDIKTHGFYINGDMYQYCNGFVVNRPSIKE